MTVLTVAEQWRRQADDYARLAERHEQIAAQCRTLAEHWRLAADGHERANAHATHTKETT